MTNYHQSPGVQPRRAARGASQQHGYPVQEQYRQPAPQQYAQPAPQNRTMMPMQQAPQQYAYPAQQVPPQQMPYGAPQQSMGYGMPGMQPKSKAAAIWMRFLLGPFGVTPFYMGYTGMGFLQLVYGLLYFASMILNFIPLGFIVPALLSLGGLTWSIIDAVRISNGSLPDARGIPLV